MKHVGDYDVLANSLHVEGYIAAWQPFIEERIFPGTFFLIRGATVGMLREIYALKCTVINIYATLSKIRNVEVELSADERRGQARVG